MNFTATLFIFDIHVDDDFLYREIENQSSPAYSSLFLSNFLSLYTLNNAFLAKVSPQPCKLEILYLVYTLMTTCCIVGLRTSFLLLLFTVFV